MTINGIFNKKVKNVLLAASLLAVAGFLSRVLGFGRNALLAYHFGASDTLDAYFLAFNLPDFFFNLLLFGAFSAGFVPVFIKLRDKDEKEAWLLTNDILNLTLVIFTFFGALFFITAPWVLKLIAPGFDPQKLALAVTLSRIMFLQPIFLGLSVIFSGILQASHKFLSYALAPICYNIGIIFGILVLSPHFGPAGLAWGVVLGAIFHMLVQYPAAKASGFKYKLAFSFKGKIESLKRIFHIIVPRSASLILSQLNMVIMAAVASFLGTGRVSIFNFADDLNSLILGVVAIPLGVAVFPVFAQAFSHDKLKEFGELVVKTLRQLIFVMIPATVLFFVLRAQIVRLALGYGKFNWNDTVLTISTLSYFLIGLIFQGILAIILRAYFAMEDAKTTFWVLFLGILLSLGFSLVAAPKMDAPALSLAMSLGAFFDTVVLVYILNKKIGPLGLGKLLRPAGIFVIGSILGGLSAYTVLYISAKFLDTHRVLHLIIQGGSAGLVGILVYLGVNLLFKVEELEGLKFKIGLKEKIILPSLDEEARLP